MLIIPLFVYFDIIFFIICVLDLVLILKNLFDD